MRKWLEKKSQSAGRDAGRSFEKFDNCRIAVRHNRFGPQPLVGTARYQQDESLGNVLRIALEGDLPGSPDIIVSESEWNGLIVRDVHYGCDYCLFLATDA